MFYNRIKNGAAPILTQPRGFIHAPAASACHLGDYVTLTADVNAGGERLMYANALQVVVFRLGIIGIGSIKNDIFHARDDATRHRICRKAVTRAVNK